MAIERKQSVFALLGIAIVLAAVLLYVMGPTLLPPQEERGPKRVYFADRISTAHRILIQRFNDLHGGSIEVVPVDLPFDKFSTNERKELLARSLRSRSDKLDVFAVDHIWVRRFARWCEPLGSYVSQEDTGRILPVALKSCMNETTLVALPLYMDIGLLYYRSDVIGRLSDAASLEQQLRNSMSWSDFLRLSSRLGPSYGAPYLFQADEYEGLICNYLELAVGQDPAFLESGRIDLSRPAARTALQMMVDLVQRTRTSPDAVIGFDEERSYRYLLAGRGVFVRGWPNFVENYRKRQADTTILHFIRKAALPHFEGRPPTSVIGGWNLMLSKFSSRKSEALEFIRFLQTKEAQRILYEVDGFLPVAEDIYHDSAYVQRNGDLLYYHQLLERGFNRPGLVDYTRISDILSHFLREAIAGNLAVPEALQQASDMITTNKVLLK